MKMKLEDLKQATRNIYIDTEDSEYMFADFNDEPFFSEMMKASISNIKTKEINIDNKKATLIIERASGNYYPDMIFLKDSERYDLTDNEKNKLKYQLLKFAIETNFNK